MLWLLLLIFRTKYTQLLDDCIVRRQTCLKVTIQDHEETPLRGNETAVTRKRTQKLPSVWELNTHHSLSLYVCTKTQEEIALTPLESKRFGFSQFHLWLLSILYFSSTFLHPLRRLRNLMRE